MNNIVKIKLNHKLNNDLKNKSNIYRGMLLGLSILFFMFSIGYAALSSSTEISGNISANSFGEMFISSVLIDEYNGVTQNTIPTYSNVSLSTDVDFDNNDYSYITYEVTIANGTSDYQRFTSVQYNATDTV